MDGEVCDQKHSQTAQAEGHHLTSHQYPLDWVFLMFPPSALLPDCSDRIPAGQNEGQCGRYVLFSPSELSQL